MKSKYSANNRDQIVPIKAIPNLENVPSDQVIFEELKTISKSIEEDENLTLINRDLFGGWISVAKRAYSCVKYLEGKDLPRRFCDSMNKECGIRKQRIYDCLDLFMLTSVATRLLNC